MWYSLQSWNMQQILHLTIYNPWRRVIK
jgi:hypothetical protein